ncbi:hypothetical protein K469DRAFT_714515 [Zopfia rhizophila CBS 207.26]|uniref:Uncharacterized protein n=1 Tax=Zopfia rhizophila CBS 207.26 TaxID=1314779 RepID=A0A6A6DQM2_9PEZI|nr:hypothetical protein K469DRAFT_714515 [Zopfia rhizophila CBS 207.26]
MATPQRSMCVTGPEMPTVCPPILTTTPGSPRKSASAGVSHAKPVIQPEDKLDNEAKEAEERLCFQNAVEETLEVPNGYLKVSVLLFKWEEKLDEYHEKHEQEITRLVALFEEKFHFDCRVVHLSNSKKPQHQLNREVASHIEEYDDPHNLLIFYYTGHGCSVGPQKKLELTATRRPTDNKSGKRPVACWNEAERPLLQSAESDVLTILDCCFASNAVKGVSPTGRTYDLLAAAPMNERTGGPGPNSFTNALIRALEDLVELKRFSTLQLQQRIKKIRETPTVELWDRLETGQYLPITLAPLDRTEVAEKRRKFERRAAEKASLTIRFSLVEALTIKQIEEFGRQLPEACKKSDVLVRNINWMGMKPSMQRGRSFKGTAGAFRAASRIRRLSNASTKRGPGQKISPTSNKRSSSESLLSPEVLTMEPDAMSLSGDTEAPSAPPSPHSETVSEAH